MQELDPRVIFAAERTMLAWIRTGLSLMGFGFVVARFSLLLKEIGILTKDHQVRTPGLSLWIGVVLVILGVVINFYAGKAYSNNINRIKNHQQLKITQWPMGRVMSIVLSIFGLLMASYLLLLK